MNTRQQLSFSFPELWLTVFQNSTANKFANIWRIKWVGISVMKFEVARINFLSDVFVAIVVLVA